MNSLPCRCGGTSILSPAGDGCQVILKKLTVENAALKARIDDLIIDRLPRRECMSPHAVADEISESLLETIINELHKLGTPVARDALYKPALVIAQALTAASTGLQPMRTRRGAYTCDLKGNVK